MRQRGPLRGQQSNNTIFSVGTSTLAQVYCQLGLAYDHRIHTCNWPDLLMEYAGQTFLLDEIVSELILTTLLNIIFAGCDPGAALGDFR